MGGVIYIRVGELGPVGSVYHLVGGTGYVDGTYTNVPLTQGNGSGAQATIVVSGGIVTSVTITAGGTNYITYDILSASNTNLGGTGSGFATSIQSVGTGAGPVFWAQVDGGIFSGDEIVDMALIDSTHAVVVTAQGNAGYTTDGGHTWTHVPTPVVGITTFNSIQAGNGVVIASAQVSGTLHQLRSTDGGATWAAITEPVGFTYNTQPTQPGYSSLGFWYMFGDNGGNVGIAVSHDDGATWGDVTISGVNDMVLYTLDNTNMQFIAGGIFYVVGQAFIPAVYPTNSTATILKTTDGISWSVALAVGLLGTQDLPVFFEVAIMGSTIYTVGATYLSTSTGTQTGTIVYASSDNGVTWSQLVYTNDTTVPPWGSIVGEGLVAFGSTLVVGFDPSDFLSLGTSPDGSSWSVNSSDTTELASGTGIATDATTLYAYGDKVIGTTDLSTWTVDVDVSIGGDIVQVRSNGSLTLAAGTDNSGNGGIWLKP